MTTDPRLDFIDRLQAATKERMQHVQQVAEQVGEISGEATSPDRLVTVKVTPTGALLDLVLDDEALDLDARDLAALVLATARTATERAAGALKEVVAPLEAPLDVSGGSTDELATPSRDSAAFDAALDRADHVADSVEDRIRGLDAEGR